VVFVHGLLGSPVIWSVMLDQLAADPTVAAQFQFLTLRYDSFASILDSGPRLAGALDEARRRFDPEGHDGAFDQVVLVGHSVGGLVAKAAARSLVPSSARTAGSPAGAQPRPVTPRVGRLVFLATPHHGSPLDQGPVHLAGRWLAGNLSSAVVARRVRADVPSDAGGFASSVDQLSTDHPVLVDLERSSIAAAVPFHSIIAVLADPKAQGATDGVVPLASARLASARSELIVRTHHLCFQHPDVIREVRRILIVHAAGGRLSLGNDDRHVQP
jgi:pimeloyl-ACP methyl ester carboxylesterase